MPKPHHVNGKIIYKNTCLILEDILCHRGKVAGMSGAEQMIDRKPSDSRGIAEDLIAEAQAARIKTHVQAMFSRLKARHRTQPKQTA